MSETAYPFEPESYRDDLLAVLGEVAERVSLEPSELKDILRRHPKDGRGFFSKSELIRGLRHLRSTGDCDLDEGLLIERLRMKPIRTLSGVAPVTVLTKPYACPGRCIFCPSDVRMPKSYLSDEPGAQRAAEHQFDPYRQTLSRLLSFTNTGHEVDKVELIILGGTWSFYPEEYQIWFVERCFDALNDFGQGVRELPEWLDIIDYRDLEERVEGRGGGPRYNHVVGQFAQGHEASGGQVERERSTWESLVRAQGVNESSSVRCVGLVVETRPDRLDAAEAERIRRLGATKVQIGIQSTDDRVLELNQRGHTVAQTRSALRLLRAYGFKIHAHWMPNLHGSSVQDDIEDFRRLFDDAALRPDELKVYPCSLIESAELMQVYERGDWRPYEFDELLEVVTAALAEAPEYCRLTRVIRDIPGTDIVDGNKITNFRQVAERELTARGQRGRDIRAREVRGEVVRPGELTLSATHYDAGRGQEVFLQMVTADDRLAGFLRLHLPSPESEAPSELRGRAVIREVHVYGAVVGLGSRDQGRAQHMGVGRALIHQSAALADQAGFGTISVISAIGTRRYYRRLGFEDGDLYMHAQTASLRPFESSLSEHHAGTVGDGGMNARPTTHSPLLTDLYQLTMAQGYWRRGLADRRAVCHLFVRRAPFAGAFTVLAGLDSALERLESFRFRSEDVDYLRSLGELGGPDFDDRFLKELEQRRPSCSVDAMPEGTLVLAGSPVLETRGSADRSPARRDHAAERHRPTVTDRHQGRASLPSGRSRRRSRRLRFASFVRTGRWSECFTRRGDWRVSVVVQRPGGDGAWFAAVWNPCAQLGVVFSE